MRMYSAVAACVSLFKAFWAVMPAAYWRSSRQAWLLCGAGSIQDSGAATAGLVHITEVILEVVISPRKIMATSVS